ncbi:MAG: TonB-dependent receptor [Blastocatellia bacterium]|nr:TonB-dependent receptor [Blastocatellia bacterium]
MIERKGSLRLCGVLVFTLALCFPVSAFNQAIPKNFRVEGKITDQAGAPVVGAEVALSSGSFSANKITDDEGRFLFEPVPSDGGTLTVKAQGFAAAERRWSIREQNGVQLTVVLAPAPLSEQMTVTAARAETRVSDTAASIAVLTTEDLSATAALTLDDALRQVPGFSLFRRSGSRTANPTIQGVSLRGVGASGASRAVVLNDSVPLNDPFGGWVYWNRTPRESINRVELVRGGASHLYGTDGLGGVINFIPRSLRDHTLSLETSYGNQQTPNASLFVGGRFNQWGLSLAAEASHTDGYRIVDERERGLVDTPAGVEYTVLELTLDRMISDRGRIFARGSVFGESRENGTPLQTNRTHIRQLSVGSDWQSEALGSFVLRFYGGAQVFDQDFTAVAADRNSENLTRSQRVPAQQTGLVAQWSRSAGTLQTLVAGIDARQVRGASDELGFFGGRATSAVGSGGRESILGVFGQDILRIHPRWFVTVGARVDRWRNYDALSTSLALAQPGAVTVRQFDDRTETAFSPRLSVLHKLTENVSLTASGYRAFRAPTLNELYRAFRVGNIVTTANEDLRAERLTGGEGGASISALNQKLNVRGAFFWSEVTRAVANVTLSVTPDLITRQRQNLGRTRSRGVELEAEARITGTMTLSGGYLFADATVLEFPANTALEGLLIPQVPRHQFTFQARYADPRVMTLGFQGRAIGAQFDDDQNRLQLDRFFTLDALVSRSVARGVEVFAAVENIFDRRYTVGRTPVRTIGPPTLARFGIKLRMGSR